MTRAERFGMSLGIMAAIAALLVGILQPWESATAKDERVVPVHFLVYRNTYDAVGDSCAAYVDESRFFTTPQQLVIEDETGAVVAFHELTGTVDQDSNGNLRCREDFTIPVPESGFYTVRLGDERIRTYAADEFPIDPADAIFVSLQEDQLP